MCEIEKKHEEWSVKLFFFLITIIYLFVFFWWLWVWVWDRTIETGGTVAIMEGKYSFQEN